MLRNKAKILVRAQPPFPPCSAFALHQLTLAHSHPFPFTLSCKLHSLCWNLSRKWRLACFSDSFDIYIVHHKSQSDSAAQVVKEIKEALPVTDVFVGDGEVISGSLISKAVDCSLRSLLLEKNWKCVGDGYIVNSSFSPSEEKSHVYALDVEKGRKCYYKNYLHKIIVEGASSCTILSGYRKLWCSLVVTRCSW